MDMSGDRHRQSSMVRRRRALLARRFLDAYKVQPSLEAACEQVGLDPRTLQNWRRQYPDFDYRVLEIKRGKAERMKKELWDVATIPLSVVLEDPRLATPKIKAA